MTGTMNRRQVRGGKELAPSAFFSGRFDVKTFDVKTVESLRQWRIAEAFRKY
jgi:hypothetical protein